MAAELFWPSLKQSQPEYFAVPDILEKLVPEIPEQLSSMGFVEEDFKPLLVVLEERLANRQTGAQWQLDKLAALREDMHKREALFEMLQQYQHNCAANIPVAQWQ